ncbi:MAG: hypothetical protein ACP5L5_11265, partial [Vulcanisaeta sp.]
GISSIEVANIKMSVIVQNGSVELRVRRKDYGDAVRILETLRNAGYERVELSKRSNMYVVYISMDVIKKYPELTAKVCEVLRRMHEEAKNKGKEKRARSIAKAIKKLRNEDGLSVSL